MNRLSKGETDKQTVEGETDEQTDEGETDEQTVEQTEIIGKTE